MISIGPKQEVMMTKEKISRRWKCKGLSPATLFVGFQMERNRSERKIFIHQEMYVMKLLEKLKMDMLNPSNLPIPAGTVLKNEDSDHDCTADEAMLYRQIIGSTIYLANNTRQDISYAVGQLARFMATPKQRFLHLSKHLLRHLNGTRKLGITYQGKGPSIEYSVYTDATWGMEDDRKSFMGFIVMYNRGPISWQAEFQKSTAQSTLEAEIISANEGTKRISCLEKIWKDIGHKQYVPILYCENDPAFRFSKDSNFHGKAKQI
ncbi:hypothetical protein K3495_g7554 [Podosphaera aphanis]|nr:hypothetical protein K3495_g7554 [Podosphaera aphanis]